MFFGWLVTFAIKLSKPTLNFEINKVDVRIMYLLTEWEGWTGKYLARGHGVRTERSKVREP